jgi:hypothetical protein
MTNFEQKTETKRFFFSSADHLPDKQGHFPDKQACLSGNYAQKAKRQSTRGKNHWKVVCYGPRPFEILGLKFCPADHHRLLSITIMLRTVLKQEQKNQKTFGSAEFRDNCYIFVVFISAAGDSFDGGLAKHSCQTLMETADEMS